MHCADVIHHVLCSVSTAAKSCLCGAECRSVEPVALGFNVVCNTSFAKNAGPAADLVYNCTLFIVYSLQVCGVMQSEEQVVKGIKCCRGSGRACRHAGLVRGTVSSNSRRWCLTRMAEG